MIKKLSLLMLLMALFAPWAANAQTDLCTQTFEDMSSIATNYSSSDWYAYNAGSGNNWTLNTSSTYANGGSKSAQVKYHSSNAANCYLVSAPFNVSANMTELSVSLYDRSHSTSYTETYEVFFVKASDVTNDAGVASATKYSAFSTTTSSTSYSLKSGFNTNSALAGQSVRVVVHCTSIANQWYLYIDDITVSETTSGSGGGGDDPSGCAVIGTGTTATSSGGYGGIYTYFNRYAYTQQLYLASELTAAGASRGLVENIALKYAESTDSDLTFEVYLGQTTSTTVPTSWITDANLKRVYSGTTTFSGNGQWNFIDVSDANWVWDGTSNIVVAIRRTDKTSGAVSYPDFYVTSCSDMVVYCYDSNNNISLNSGNYPSTTGSTTGQRTDMQFCIAPSSLPIYTVTVWASPEEGGTVTGGGDYLEGTECTVTATPNEGYNFDYWIANGTGSIAINPLTFTVDAPTDLQAHFSQNPSHTLTFDANPTDAGMITVTQNGIEVTSGQSIVETTTLNITATPNAGFYFSGWTVTGTGASVASATSASTTLIMGTDSTTLTANFEDCAITTFPWSETFEDYASGTFNVSCWENVHISGSGSSLFSISTSSLGGNSSHKLQLPDQSQGTMTKLRLPKMVLPNAEYQFVIDVYRNNSTYSSESSNEGIRVFLSTDGEIEGATELAFISRQYNASHGSIPAESAVGWYTYKLPLGISGTCYIILRGESQYCTSTYMDNFNVIAIPNNPLKIVAENPADDEMTWDQFADYVAAGDDYYGKTVTLMEDITVNQKMVGSMNGEIETGLAFSGIFEGNGHTLTFNYNQTGSSYQYTAPFCFINGATIQNLTIDGTIYTTALGAAGLVGYGQSTNHITNCVSHITINSSFNDEGTYGGFMSNINMGCTVYFEGCAFTGTFNGKYNGGNAAAWGGFAGWSEDGYFRTRAYSHFTNCVFAPTDIDVSNISCKPFTRSRTDDYVYITNCYYLDNALGTDQGKQAYTITAESPVTVAMNGEHTYYNVSGIDAYTTGIVYDGNLYAGNGDNLSLALSGSSSDVYEADHGTLTADGENFTLAMEAFNTMIRSINCPVPFNVAANNVEARSAQITWEGNSDTYKLMYRNVITPATEVNDTYDFEDNTLQGWTTISNDADNNAWSIQSVSGSAHGGTYYVRSRYTSSGDGEANDWLISPQIPLGGTFSFFARRYSTSYTDQFQVYVSTTGNNISDFTAISEVITPNSTYSLYEYDLSSYSGNGYVAIVYTAPNNQYYVYVDDITITTYIEGEYGEWQTVNDAASPQALSNLTPETTYQVKVSGICDGVETNESQVVEFTTPVSCPAPTNLIVSDIDAHGATVSWDRIATQETGDITFHYTWVEHGGTPDWTLHGGMSAIDRWTNEMGPRAFAFGLDPETTYDFYVRRDCGEDDYSAEVMVSFSTTIACQVPTDVTVSGITGHEATVTWTGYSDSYIVSYRTAAYLNGISEEFNSSSTPTGWSKYLGLVDNIIAGTATLSETGSGWTTSSYALGTYNMKINVYGLNCNYWLVTPEVAIDNNFELNFDLALTDYGNANPIEDPSAQADDRFVVLIYTNNAWQILREWNNAGSANIYNNISATGENVTIDLSAYYGKTVKIAFYSESTVGSNGDNDLHIDNVSIGYPVAAGEWQTVTAEETTVLLTSLISETIYEVVVQGDCGEDGLSNESTPVTFTTLVSCPAPTDLTASDITPHEANVSWTGYSNNYIVNYRTASTIDAALTEGFEDNGSNIPSGWTHIGNGSLTMDATASRVHTGTYSLKFSGATSDNVVVLPELGSGANTMEVSFWSLAENGSSSGTFQVGYVTDATDASTFHEIVSYNASSHLSYTQVNVSLASAPTGARVAFRHTSASTVYYWWIDDIVIGYPVAAGEWQTVTAEETSVTLTDLIPETLYEVVVLNDCGDEGMSIESEPITFTTDIACPAPTDLAATNITSNSAVLHWTGDAESYNVSYNKAYFFDSFEEDLSQWTIYKEGDDASGEWGIENPHDNSSDLNAHSGSFAAVAYSDIDVHADNWLITPQIMMPTQATLKFWVMCSTYDEAQDEYEVRLSNTGNAISDFTIVLKEKEAANSTWTEVSIDLSEYEGQQCYIAIRHDFTGGFFLMVDDFGIFGWSEEITTTENSLLIEDLLPETEYMWHVQANCGEEDGMSQWSNIGTFTTLKACPAPFDLTATEITANGATIAWTGYNDSYDVWVGELEIDTISYNFEDGLISAEFTNSTSYPWTVVSGGQNGSYCIKSSNAGVAGSTSSISFTMTSTSDGTIEFDAECKGEGTSSYFDHCDFYIDNNRKLYAGANISGWNHYSYEVTAGEHTFTWSYTKDSSVNPTGDYFAVDNIVVGSTEVTSWTTYTATESPLLINDATNILPETTYSVKVIGFCDDVATEDSEIITFTTLDENTKIFVTEGDWSDGDNWVPVGVPSIDDDVILRAEATVFDVAEANNITIDDAGALTIEDGGQLKTNANVEATMKKFIIGYGTDYVETNNGYYLLTLPTAVPIAAADAGLITEESDYDLYVWDGTATDEEWQNNHDGIDLQNGIGFLYANRDDMEMNFTATLLSSGEPVTIEPYYDDVEHGGWSLYGNPFPCEVYITTDAEGMTFYRLVDNELVPIEGAIAPLEAFFVKATAAGQTFTISREAPAK